MADEAKVPSPPSDPGASMDYDRIKQRLHKSASEHSTTLDAWCFNGGTVLTLLFTGAATLFASTFGPNWGWLSAIFSCLAGVLVAVERALALGARWRFHHEMRNGYLSVVDMIDLAMSLPNGGEQQQKLNAEILGAMKSVRSRESLIPGTGIAPQ